LQAPMRVLALLETATPKLEVVPVSTRVNSPTFDDVTCRQPV